MAFRYLRLHHWHGLAFVTACSFGSSDYNPRRDLVVAQLEANPLLGKIPSKLRPLPRYAEIQAPHVKTAVDQQMRYLRDDFDKLLLAIERGEEVGYDSIVEDFERMKAPLESTLAVVEHLLMVNQNDPLQFAHNMCLTSVIQLNQEMAQSPTIFSGLCNIKNDTKLWKSLTSTQRKVVNIQIHDMQRNGVGFTVADKEKFNNLQMNLAHLQAKFNSNVFKSSQGFKITLKKQTSVEGMPELLKRSLAQNATKEGHRMATAEAGPWVVTLDDYHPCMQHLKSRKMRQVLYQQHKAKATTEPFNNSILIHNILKDKQALANLLGFKNYAEFSLDSKMAPDIATVLNLFTVLQAKALPLAQNEMAALRDFIKNQPGGEEVAQTLMAWDIPYWSERLKENQFQLKQEELKVYFPLDRVLQGLFALIERLFAVRIEEVPAGQQQVWHSDVRLFYIFPSSSSSSPSSGQQTAPIAAFYLDPYCRPGRKKAGNWMNPMATKSEVLQQNLPVAHFVLNISPPLTKEEPALLTLDEVETLFHETGHGLQHMLTSVKHGAVSGINNIAWDTVELPSQFMENWVYDKLTVCSFAQHYLTGDPLPEALFVKMKAAKNFQAGRRLLHQLYLGALDLALHSVYDPMHASGVTPLQFMHSEGVGILAQFLLEPLHPDDLSLCSFGHIFSGGYAAGYYSYLWAEVMSADAFASFEEAGLDNEAAVRATGVRFRDTFLASGGATESAEVFRRFRGRDATPAALLRHRGLGD